MAATSFVYLLHLFTKGKPKPSKLVFIGALHEEDMLEEEKRREEKRREEKRREEKRREEKRREEKRREERDI